MKCFAAQNPLSRVWVGLFVLAGCTNGRWSNVGESNAAECPASLTSAASMGLHGGAPWKDFSVVTSAEELEADAKSHIAVAESEPVHEGGPVIDEAGAFEVFRKGTDFTQNDVAIVRAGGARGVMIGVREQSTSTGIYFYPACSPCGGGHPGSYYAAKASYDAATNPWTALVRIKKGTSVSIEMCAIACGACSKDVP